MALFTPALGKGEEYAAAAIRGAPSETAQEAMHRVIDSMVADHAKGYPNGLNPEDAATYRKIVDQRFVATEGRTHARVPMKQDLLVLRQIAREKGLDALRTYVQNANTSTDPKWGLFGEVQMQPEQKEELLKSIDMVDRKLQDSSTNMTRGQVVQDSSTRVQNIMDKLGAQQVENSMAPTGTGTWGRLIKGKMHVVYEGGDPLDDQAQADSVHSDMEDLVPTSVSDLLGWNNNPGIYAANQAVNDANLKWSSAITMAGREQALSDWERAANDLTEAYTQAVADTGHEYTNTMLGRRDEIAAKLAKSTQQAREAIASAQAKRVNAPKRIEFVPWDQPGQTHEPTATEGAGGKMEAVARSQRGRLSLYGYTPEEAAAKLKELGIVGDLEDSAPAGVIFRSTRRVGDITPLHPDYVRGEAPPPTMKYLMTHGFTDTGASPLDKFKLITSSGGLMSIQDRTQRGIQPLNLNEHHSSSPVGDTLSGVDHVVFCAMNSGGTCGSGSEIRIGLRPETTMRRDILTSDTDYGGGNDRYPNYKAYLEDLERRAGQEVGKTTLWTPLSPEARQIHLDNKADYPGTAEFNVAHQVRVEDMEFVACKDRSTADGVQAHLDALLKAGIVTRIPRVITSDEWEKNVNL